MAGLSTWLFRIAAGAGSVGAVVLGLLYVFQEKLLYVPRIPGVPDDYALEPDKYGLSAEDITISAKDGVRLHAWMLKLPRWGDDYTRSRPVVLFFQENAGNMSFRLPYLRRMAQHLECPILAVSYRGYFKSEGRPSEAGLMQDARAALEYLSTRNDVDSRRVVVFGRSLGGAVALHVTAENPDKVTALIIENTFTSVEAMVSRVFPPLGLLIGPRRPFNFLVRNKWYNEKEIRRVKKTPMLLVVSELDEMVPASQMYELYGAQRTEQCTLVTIPGAHHMDAYDTNPQLYWSALTDFMMKYVDTA